MKESEDDSPDMVRYQIKKEEKTEEFEISSEVQVKKIFEIIKIPKNDKINQALLIKKRSSEDQSNKKKNNLVDSENIFVPKEKHFHFDRKKHRIVFQRNHLKIIYLKFPCYITGKT